MAKNNTDPRYHTPRWRALRKSQLISEPLCRMCTEQDRTTPATVCDHITPHKGDDTLFWYGPFQSLCSTCHSSYKQSAEATGMIPGCDEDGLPLDPAHPWRKA